MYKKIKNIILILTLSISTSLINSSAEEINKFKVGVLAPLSGPVAQMGEAFRHGFELYQEENPMSDVEYVYEDTKYEGKTSLTASHKLKDINHVDLNIVWGNMPSSTCAPIAEQQKLPMIGISMNPDAKQRDYVVTLGPPNEVLIDRVHEQFKTWNLIEPAAISIDIGSALTSIEILKKKMSNKILVKTIASDESDFKTLITILKKKGVDGLLLFSLPDQALTFLDQAKQLNYFPKIIGGDAFADMTFQNKSIKLNQNISFVYGAVDSKFIKKLTDKYKNASYFYETASGYAVASMLEELQIKLKNRNKDINILSQIETIDLSNSPIINLRDKNTQDYGRHFEADGQVYNLPLLNN